ncbi:MAG: transporter [bacterium]|nr:transporter [bacterium]
MTAGPPWPTHDQQVVTRIAIFSAVVCLWSVVSLAQELSPRAYWPAPTGTRVAIFGYSYSTGDVLMDPSLPIYGVDSKINTGVLGYLQTFSLWGRTTNIVFELPYSWGTTTGLLSDDEARRDYSGFNDFAITLAVNLLGAPAMDVSGFQALRSNPHPILGVSLKVQAPTGHYNPNRLINTGANRWSVKAEMGTVIPLNSKWLLELEAGVWFFGDDPEYIQGRREQEGIIAAEIHLVRRFKPGFWASLEANYYTGGRQTIAGDKLVDLQRNSRFGGTVVVPFKGRHAVKFGYSAGVTTDFGTDFDQFLASYQVLF